MYVIPAPYQVRGKLQPESSIFKGLWMPDQVRHDGRMNRKTIFSFGLGGNIFILTYFFPSCLFFLSALRIGAQKLQEEGVFFQFVQGCANM